MGRLERTAKDPKKPLSLFWYTMFYTILALELNCFTDLSHIELKIGLKCQKKRSAVN